MYTRFLMRSAPIILAALWLATPAAAQSSEKVKTDVLSALSTPLPITIIGPLLTPDVEVAEEGDGFRATLKSTTLMGFFPIGDVSMHLVALDAETYRISDMRLPPRLDFPGMAVFEHSGMELEGTWSATRRSYSDLKWLIRDLKLTPEGRPGQIEIGSLSFDVVKEPDETDTESRFAIGATGVSVTGLMPDDVKLGSVQATLLANGNEPVDLYSVIREAIMRANMRDGGEGLQALAASLLGKSYALVSLELAAEDLDIAGQAGPDPAYFRAETLALSATLNDVEPRQWGSADITLTLGALDQHELAGDGTYSVGEAKVSLSGAELPVADMFKTYMLFASGAHGPVKASDLLAGLASFGRIEITTDGKALALNTIRRVYPSDPAKAPEKKPHFEIGYDSWALQIGMADFIRNEGKIALTTDFVGGHFTPLEAFDTRNLPEIEAWFPRTLRLQSSVSSLNEGFLKQLFKDVSIHDLNEPAEIILPLILYVGATVFDMESGEDVYETALFSIAQEGRFRFYPTELFSLVPYEGDATLRMKGFDNLLGYFEKMPEREGPAHLKQSELSIIRSVMMVLRNLATEPEAGALEWAVSKPDVGAPQVLVNGVTFRYPEFAQLMPMMFAATFGRF